jgi:hypothetical protein
LHRSMKCQGCGDESSGLADENGQKPLVLALGFIG